MHIGNNSTISPDVVLEQPEKIYIGDNVQIKKGVVLRPETGFIYIGNNVVIKNQKKLKNLITPETRISLFQTAMNNSGRNFEGKRVPAKRMAEYTSEIYKLAIKEIENIGELSIRQIQSTIMVEPTKKQNKKSNLKKLMGRIKRGGRNGR